MPRIDVWDVQKPPEEPEEPLWVGFTRTKLEDRYNLGKQLGQGGFGSVQIVVERTSGKEYACKSIAKRLTIPNASSDKQNQHLENIRREALILRRLRGTLNVVHLEDVFEDEDSVHMVMEWCKGGELLQRINTRHYSERTAASYMRAVLRTLAQCHHLRILHRDIKPGNFMLLTDADNAPVKAIDFGLAVFFDPKKLPRKDLGLEGTPHFMAPEQLSGQTWPASDIWSAGVMAYQLLCGFVPFDDTKNPRAPALSLVWRAILTEEPKFTHRSWEGISEQAKDFVRSLLIKDPKNRPTAKQALSHPWLQGKAAERTQGAPLARTVVQRLQKFGVESALKRTVLDMIANELINRHLEQMTQQQQQQQQPEGEQEGQQREHGGGEREQQQQQQHQQPGGDVQQAQVAAVQSPQDRPPGDQQGPEAAMQPRKPATKPPTSAFMSTGDRSARPAVRAGDGSPAAGLGSPGRMLAGDASSSRMRVVAAQDLLFRTAHKHATVHAGGDALAALRRGQLMGLSASRAPSGAAAAAAAGPPLPLGPTTSSSLAAAAAAALQQQFHQRRSHDLGQRSPAGASAAAAGGSQGQPGERRPASPSTQAAAPPPASAEPNWAEPPPWVDTARGVPPAATAATVAAPPPSRGGVPPLPSGGFRAGLGPLAAGAAAGRPGGGGAGPAGGPATAATAGGATVGSAGAGAAAAGGGGGSGGSYRGPVKDQAAAKAWDMSYMAGRRGMGEGSGHKLQHYAWLLNMGERSLHSVLERGHQAAGVGGGAAAGGRQPGVSPVDALLGGAAAAAAPGGGGGSSFVAAPPRRSHTTGLPSSSPGGAAQGRAPGQGLPSPGAGQAGGEAGGGSDYLRMLSLVAKQRAEHRKYQRLSLDTSGHRQSHYARLMRGHQAGGEGQEEADEEEEGEGDGEERGVAGGRRLGGIALESVEDDEDEEGGGRGGPGGTTTADTTGAYSLPVPSGASSMQVTAASLPPPSPAPSQHHLPSADGGGGVSGGAGVAMPAAPASLGPASLASQSRSPTVAPAPAGPAAAAAAADARPLKPTIPGLEEADAVSSGGAAAAGGASAAMRAMSDGRMSYTSSTGVEEPPESMASLVEGSDEGHDGGAGRGHVAAAAAAAVKGSGEEGERRTSLLKKVRKALMKPVKTLLGSAASTSAASARVSASGTGTTTPVPGPGGVFAKTSCPGLAAGGGAGGGGTLATVSTASTAAAPAEERGRGRGAYAAFLQYSGTGNNTPQERSAHGGTERSVRGGRERSGHGPEDRERAEQDVAAAAAGGEADAAAAAAAAGDQPDAAASGTAGGAGGGGRERRSSACEPVLGPSGSLVSGTSAAVPGPAGYAIHTVKAHREPLAQAAAAAATATAATTDMPPTAGAKSAAEAMPADGGRDHHQQGVQQPAEAGVAAGPRAEGGDGGAAASGAAAEKDARVGLTQEELAPALDMLLGDPAKAAELQDVMRRLHYDREEELTYEQLSEGLQWLGYRLEPSEVEDLLRQVNVGANEGLTASQFIASQVDWRNFQANHRSEWLDCLRKAFEDLGGGPGPDGRVTVEQLVAALHEKLPEEEVNLAVQESLMDAALEADAVDFDAFVKLMRCNSNDSLASAGSSELSYDLYDPRLKDASLHGPLGGDGHYQPALETVPDDQEQ